MKQKFDDLVLLLKKDRKYQIMTVIAVLGFGWALLHKPSTPNTGRRLAGQAPISAGGSSSQEAVTDLVTAFKKDLEDQKGVIRKIGEDQISIKKDFEENNARVGEIFKKVISQMEENRNAKAPSYGGDTMPTDAVGGDVDGTGAIVNVSENQGIQEFLPPTAPRVEPPAQMPRHKTAIVGVGSYVRVQLIGAVHASTDSTPYPTLFKLVGDVRGPNDSSLPLGEGLLMAAAQGSLTDSRALFRLSKLNIALPDGSTNQFDVDGWIVGEDGLSGMEGVLIDPFGKVIAGSGFAAGLQGIGDAFAAKQTTTQTNAFGGSSVSITGNEGEYAAGKGLSKATEVYAGLIKERLGKMVPMVEVLSGRQATAIFSNSFTIPGLIEAYQLEEDGRASVD